MKQATFLWQNKRGIYYFRARIPKQFAEHFTGTEIKKSLKTDSLRLALKLARAYRVELDKEMDKRVEGVFNAFQVTLKGRVKARLPDGSEQLVEGEIQRELASPDESTAEHKEYLLNQLREEAKRIEEQARQDALFQAQLAAITSQPAIVPPQAPAQQLKTTLTLIEAIQEYIMDKEALRSWKTRSGDQIKVTLRDFVEIVGDQPIDKIGRRAIADYRQKLAKLPANRKKLAQYRDLSISEILLLPEVEPMNLTTVANNLGRITPFFGWCVDREYIASNPAAGITKPLPKKKGGKQDREPFTPDELKALFYSEEFANYREPYQYWVPLIGLYHGMRLEEICKMQLSEIKEANGVWYFEIIDAKTKAGWRVVPIHRILVDELNFLAYVDGLCT